MYFYLKIAMSYFGFFSGVASFLVYGPLRLVHVYDDDPEKQFSPLSLQNLFYITSHVLIGLLPFNVNLLLMCLNGGYNLGCTKTMTLLIVFGMTHFVNAC